ncbi:unknown protein [Simkania negevensis Z]|uniref:Uncharacterized protein n=1 Tax=Simkania negevensis (strain ATCC VR-1471 / DSM 27360 / Z) TaxID=331113 RepID=F8L6B0_SIMNZ|nr:unknown protein [Simkania negevensis Z]
MIIFSNSSVILMHNFEQVELGKTLEFGEKGMKSIVSKCSD